MKQFLLSLLLVVFTSLPAFAQEEDAQVIGNIHVLHIDGAISPAYADYLRRGIATAAQNGAQAVLVELNTPGGLLTSTRQMVGDILAAPLPVIVYVTPGGAHAASAGTFLLMAGHVAAMDPGSNVGAATPVQFGDMLYGKHESSEANERALREKSLQDTTALLRAIADIRGRNVEWAQLAVINAASITAREALKNRVIDLVANDRNELLMRLDGHKITLKDGKVVVLQTKAAKLAPQTPSRLTTFLAFICDPNVAAILMMIGIYGLLLEFYAPGTWIGGTVGAISLLLGLYAMSVLPVNGLGAMLIAGGIVFAIGEIFLPSFGILGLSACLAVGFGLFILFDLDAMPGLYMHGQVIAGILGSMLLLMGLAFVLVVRHTLSKEITNGPEQMIGKIAEVSDWNGHEGHVEIDGERWNAYAPPTEASFKAGDKVLISAVDNLKLKVRGT